MLPKLLAELALIGSSDAVLTSDGHLFASLLRGLPFEVLGLYSHHIDALGVEMLPALPDAAHCCLGFVAHPTNLRIGGLHRSLLLQDGWFRLLMVVITWTRHICSSTYRILRDLSILLQCYLRQKGVDNVTYRRRLWIGASGRARVVLRTSVCCILLRKALRVHLHWIGSLLRPHLWHVRSGRRVLLIWIRVVCSCTHHLMCLHLRGCRFLHLRSLCFVLLVN